MNFRKNVIAILAAAFILGTSYADAQEKKIEPINNGIDESERPVYLQSISVTIHAGSHQGSGVIKTRDGVNYVWTAGHVIAELRSTRQVIDSKTGSTKSVVEFTDPRVVTELIEEGRSVGRLEMDAEVIRYSDAETGDDLALLRIRKKNFVRSSARFYLEDTIPSVGTRLLHVGSLHGQTGSNSLTSGIISQHGRVLFGRVFDQSTCAAFPGSSGGGVYLEKDGRYIGMIVRGAGETFNLMVPVRRMRDWAKKSNVEFALDDKVSVPSDEELRKGGIEQIGATFSSNGSLNTKQFNCQFPFLIHSTQRFPLDSGWELIHK